MAKKKAQRSKGSGCVFLPKSKGKVLSRIYRARWVVDGKTYTRTTGTSDRREAEKILDELVHPFKIETQAGKEQAQLARLKGVQAEIQAWKDAQPALSLKLAFDEYRKSGSRPNAANEATLDRYEGQYLEFCKWLAVHYPDVQELREVTDEMAQAFAAELKLTRSPNSFNKRITLFRSLWEHLAKVARLTGNPWRSIRKMELVTHTRRELTVDELSRVCHSLTGEMRLLFAVGIYTGLRLGDAATLDWGAIDLTRGIISIIPHKTARHANGKRTIIPVHPTLGAMLNEIPSSERRGYVMPETAATYGRDPTIISRRIQKAFEDNGVMTHGDVDGIGGRAQVDVGFHSLRHTFVSLSANAGVPLALVQSIVGHSNPTMTRHYFHESIAGLTSAVNALPTIPTLTGDADGMTCKTLSCASTSTGDFQAACALIERLSEDELARVAERVDQRRRELTKA